MRVDLLDYPLAPESIAQAPADDALDARLLELPVGEAGGLGRVSRRDLHIRDLPGLVAPGTLVVVNDTRVLHARLLGEKVGTQGKAEVLLVRKVERLGPREERWEALGRASKGLKPGTVIHAGPLTIRVIERGALLEVLLSVDDGTVEGAIERTGHVPLPPYIRREDAQEDRARYQTMFARVPGAVAAPTAGLHLTPALVAQMEARGIVFASVTLHVGPGTFQPVTSDDLDEHRMHEEVYAVPEPTARAVEEARLRGAPVLAIGTTVVRALESAADPESPGRVRPSSGETRLLIQPGYRFRVTDRLFTNFHLPRSTLLALVAAFAGRERILDAYRHAQNAGYRFFSYGDAMLLDRSEPRAS